MSKANVMWVGHHNPTKQEKKEIKLHGNLKATHTDAFFRGKASCSDAIWNLHIKKLSDILEKSESTTVVTNYTSTMAKRLKNSINVDKVEVV